MKCWTSLDGHFAPPPPLPITMRSCETVPPSLKGTSRLSLYFLPAETYTAFFMADFCLLRFIRLYFLRSLVLNAVLIPVFWVFRSVLLPLLNLRSATESGFSYRAGIKAPSCYCFFGEHFYPLSRFNIFKGEFWS